MHPVEKFFMFKDKQYKVVDLGNGLWTVFNSDGKNLTVKEFSAFGFVEAATIAKNS
jgi:hypothetical protein